MVWPNTGRVREARGLRCLNEMRLPGTASDDGQGWAEVRAERLVDEPQARFHRRAACGCGAAAPAEGRPLARKQTARRLSPRGIQQAASRNQGWRAGRFRSPTDRISGGTARATARPASGEAAERIQRSGCRCPGCGRCSLRLARTTKHTALPLVERPRVPLGPARDCAVRWWPFSNCCSTPSPGPPRGRPPRIGATQAAATDTTPRPRPGRRASPNRHAGSGSCSRRGSRRAAWWGTHSWAAITSSQP